MCKSVFVVVVADVPVCCCFCCCCSSLTALLTHVGSSLSRSHSHSLALSHSHLQVQSALNSNNSTYSPLLIIAPTAMSVWLHEYSSFVQPLIYHFVDCAEVMKPDNCVRYVVVVAVVFFVVAVVVFIFCC